MSHLKRRFVVTATLLSVGLAGAWLIPFAIGDSEKDYDEKTRTVIVIVTKDDPKKPSKPDAPECVDNGPTNCPYEDEALNPAIELTDTVREAVLQMQLPANKPLFGPSPSNNQWKMVPVGYPIWLWSSDSTTSLTSTVTHDGLTIHLSATRTSVTFTMGDKHTVNCTKFTKRPTKLTGNPMKQSPNCGYVYSTAGSYKLKATANWTVRWVADGQSGRFSVTDTIASKTPLVIGELRTAITVDSQPPR